jgi:hypothetical protein
MKTGYVTAVVLALGTCAFAQQQPDWVKRSNGNAQLMIELDSKFSPENAGAQGAQGLDEQITVLPLDYQAKVRAATVSVRDELKKRLMAEKDSQVKQDLEILIEAATEQIDQIDAEEKTFFRYVPVANLLFYGEKTLLDERIAPARRQAAVVRLRKYAGMEPGYAPITEEAKALWMASLKKPGAMGPAKDRVQNDLRDMDTFLAGIGALLEKSGVKGYEEPLAKLKGQLTDYRGFVEKEVLPRTRTDFRLPPAIYRVNLENYGVDYTPEDLTRMAHAAFTEIQKEMTTVAARVAKEHGWAAADYRSVISQLKKEQFQGDEILPKYEATLHSIEDIIRKNHLVTLPQRPAEIVIASAAETAQQPAPHMSPPPLLNNTGQRGRFVLPLEKKGENGADLKYDDFTFQAAAWTMTAHEARPGHELQFDSMVEHGVSLARAVYAFNSTNVEGWGLYAEWFMLPYMPDDGKLISLQFRLLRAARAFLDPELQAGKITPEQAMKVLQDDVVCSKPFAQEEVERFTFRMPGQAVSYFDGYTRLMEIRQAAEKAMGAKFDQGKFHDFILAQGLLPPGLLRKAVMEDFVRNN